MNKKERIEYFEKNTLNRTCFYSLKELLADKTLIHVNAPRALIACYLSGRWRGFNDGLDLQNKK